MLCSRPVFPGKHCILLWDRGQVIGGGGGGGGGGVEEQENKRREG